MAGVVATSAIAYPAAADAWSDVEAGIAVDGQPIDGDHIDVLDAYGWVAQDELADARIVVTPGTDDSGLSARIHGIVGARDTKIVQYPQAIWPVSTGQSGALLPFFAPTYDKSRDIAVDRNVEIMRALRGADRVIVYTGYSQGSEALGNAVEQASAQGLLDENTLILLTSDPRGPWGLKSGLQSMPGADIALAFVGVESNGARDPEDSGDTRVVQVIVKGDPVADWQWNPVRPVSSLLVNGAGFLTVHAGTGKYSYAHLENLDHEGTYYSAEGNTTYEVYDTYHPLALLRLATAEALGIDVPQTTLERWDRQAEQFYPTEEVSPETADPSVKVLRDDPRSETGDDGDGADRDRRLTVSRDGEVGTRQTDERESGTQESGPRETTQEERAPESSTSDESPTETTAVEAPESAARPTAEPAIDDASGSDDTSGSDGASGSTESAVAPEPDGNGQDAVGQHVAGQDDAA